VWSSSPQRIDHGAPLRQVVHVLAAEADPQIVRAPDRA
jgi:hypothetical protein